MKVLKQIVLAVIVGMLIVVGLYALGDTQAEVDAENKAVVCSIVRDNGGRGNC